MANTVTWSSYEFTVYPANGTTWNNVAGIYIFTGLTPENHWRPYYIGQADNFANRLPNHERWAEAARLGATHIHALVVPLAANRDTIEETLIQTYQPRLNTQLK